MMTQARDKDSGALRAGVQETVVLFSADENDTGKAVLEVELEDGLRACVELVDETLELCLTGRMESVGHPRP